MTAVQEDRAVYRRTPDPKPVGQECKTVAKPPVRFAFVDGLRGLAAISIVIFHTWWYEPAPLAAFDSTVVDLAFFRARGGVQILLVISGFVIAYTLRKSWFSLREFQSFMVRRLVRLVPAYWVALSVVILVDFLCRGPLDLPAPIDGSLSISRIAAHMAFLQQVLEHESIGAGMWTLCIEMQFYLVAMLGWGLAQHLFLRPNPAEAKPSAVGLLIVFAPLALTSLFHWRSMEVTEPWVTHFLWMFFLGMVTWWTLDRTLPLEVFAAVVLIGSLELVLQDEWRYQNSLALATALAIFAAGYRQKLHVWLNWWPLQYLGRISYSLYLIHFPICHLITTGGWKFYGNDPSPWQARLIMLSAIPASILAGTVLYLLVEAPSARWASSTKRQTAQRPISLEACEAIAN